MKEEKHLINNVSFESFEDTASFTNDALGRNGEEYDIV